MSAALPASPVLTPPVPGNPDGAILVTGASGFLGSRVVARLVELGLPRIRCLVRPSSDPSALSRALGPSPSASVEQVTGNLLSRDDCARISRDVSVVLHLAAGTGSKSFSDAYLNSVVTTRNLVEACLATGRLQRFVSTSSFAVYSNRSSPPTRLLDETSPIEPDPASRAEAYCYAKVRQDELVMDFGRTQNLPYVLVRPGVVIGPGKASISGRIGIDSFGIFLHLGGSNRIPFTYVDNCADAIVLAGLTAGVDREIFNVVDDDLPTSRQYLRLYDRSVRPLRRIYLPHAFSYLFCWIWERYCVRSAQQLPPIYTRREWIATWRRTRYSNARLKQRLGWAPRVPMNEALRRHFDYCRARLSPA